VRPLGTREQRATRISDGGKGAKLRDLLAMRPGKRWSALSHRPVLRGVAGRSARRRGELIATVGVQVAKPSAGRLVAMRPHGYVGLETMNVDVRLDSWTATPTACGRCD